MCGITAIVGRDDASDALLTSLENLEYRGYDSAGIAVKDRSDISVHKHAGEISHLRNQIADAVPESTIGIGHTRWSTHGSPTTENAHPHTDCADQLAIVHNGIIENYTSLRAELSASGHAFESETDTEVVPHLVEEYLAESETIGDAFRRAVDRLEGTYAVAMVAADASEVYAAREGSPLVLGVADGQWYLASDVPAFLEYTDEVVYLEEGETVIVSADGYRIRDDDGESVQRLPEAVDWSADDAEKEGHPHYMKKEIHEQPTSLATTIRGRIHPETHEPQLDTFPSGAFADVRSVQLVACGTSYYAAMYGRSLLADRGIPARVFRAGEYAAVSEPVDDGTIVVGVTQSGETADTLAALRHARDAGARTLALTNVVGSTAARECDDALLIRAGPEIGVAATKTFSSQVASLVVLAERIAGDAGERAATDGSAILRALRALPDQVETVVDQSRASSLAERYRDRDAYFFIGRGTTHPVALEGALKFKEITYEHAEGFSASELKHGPLALVTERTPVFAVFSGRHGAETLANVREAQARGAPVVAVAPEGADEVRQTADEVLTVPDTHPDLTGILANVHLQLISYHVAAGLGRSIDKPRNLAKSVTVN